MDITFINGEPVDRTLKVLRTAGQPFDLFGITLTFTVREVNGTVDVLTKQLTIGNPTTSGLASLTLTNLQIAGLVSTKTYTYRVRTQTNTTIISGRLIIDDPWD